MNVQLLIDGQAVAATDGRTYDRFDPVTGQIASTAAASSKEDALKAVEAAAAAFPAWSVTGPGQRRTFLLKAADALEAKNRRIYRQNDYRNRRNWSLGRLQLYVGRWHAARSSVNDNPDHWRSHSGQQTGLIGDGSAQASWRRLGIAPWNAPVILGVRAIAMALTCGNSVILKASELCPARIWQ